MPYVYCVYRVPYSSSYTLGFVHSHGLGIAIRPLKVNFTCF